MSLNETGCAWWWSLLHHQATMVCWIGVLTWGIGHYSQWFRTSPQCNDSWKPCNAPVMYSLIWCIECTRCGCFGSFPVILAIMDAEMGCSEESFLYTTSMSLVPHNTLVCILTLIRHWGYLQKIPPVDSGGYLRSTGWWFWSGQYVSIETIQLQRREFLVTLEKSWNISTTTDLSRWWPGWPPFPLVGTSGACLWLSSSFPRQDEVPCWIGG